MSQAELEQKRPTSRHRLVREPVGIAYWATKCAGPALIAAITLVLRLVNLSTSYDLFIDEPFYTAIDQSLAGGHMPYATGSLFFLHPPGQAVLAGLWINLIGGLNGTVLTQVFAMRYFTVAFATLTAALLYVFGRRISSPGVGLMAAALYAISPWFIRQNSFVMLETPTLALVLAGYLALMYLPDQSRSGRRRLLLCIAGLCFGYGVFTKELAVFVTILPMLIIGFRSLGTSAAGRWPVKNLAQSVRRRFPHIPGPNTAPNLFISRREAMLAIAMTCVPWAIWVVVVVLNHDFTPFWAQITSGLQRASGVQQASGFNQAGTPSFVSTIVSNLPTFWTTYLLMALGALASLHLMMFSADARHRVVGTFGFGSIPLLAYSVLFGANEEQFYFYLLVPACLAVPLCVRQIFQGKRLLLLRVAICIVAATWVTSDLVNWTIIHTAPDDSTLQVDNWMRAHVPDGTTVAVTDDVQREIFLRYNMINDTSDTALDPAGGARYLVVFQKEVDQGYAFVGPTELAAQLGDKKPVFSVYGRSTWNAYIYAIN